MDGQSAGMGEMERLISEQKHGVYDFQAMQDSVTPSNIKLNNASFLKKVVVGPAGNRGKGLFTTVDIKHGDIVLVEKAFCAVFSVQDAKDALDTSAMKDKEKLSTTCCRLVYVFIDKMQYNTEQAAEILTFDDGADAATEETTATKFNVVVDVGKMHRILQRNTMKCLPKDRLCLVNPAYDEEYDALEYPIGLWLAAARMNHACLPNTEVVFFGDMLVVRATRDLKAGDELTTNYGGRANEPYARRKKRLSTRYGFICDCALCKADAKVPLLVVNLRNQLEIKIADFVETHDPVQCLTGSELGKSFLTEAKGLRGLLETTYNVHDYADLPRLDLVPLDFWLCRAGDQPIIAGQRLLIDLGFKIKVTGDVLQVDWSYCMVTREAIEGALVAARAWKELGRMKVWKGYINLARKVYAIHSGHDGKFKETVLKDEDELTELENDLIEMEDELADVKKDLEKMRI